MKKLVFLSLLTIILASCAVTTRERPRQVETFILDYRPFSETGFFLSPDPYPGSFDALGEIQINVTPARLPITKVQSKESTETGKKSFDDPVYRGNTSNFQQAQEYYVEDISSEELLEIAVNEAKKMGANGLVDLVCKASYDFVSGIKIFKGYEISGLAILRK